MRPYFAREPNIHGSNQMGFNERAVVAASLGARIVNICPTGRPTPGARNAGSPAKAAKSAGYLANRQPPLHSAIVPT